MPKEFHSGTQSDGVGSGRRASHTVKACNGCRTRKTRCSANPGETCSKCEERGEECIWTGKRDGRRAVPRPLVIAQDNRIKALEAQIATLQAALRANGLNAPVENTLPDPPAESSSPLDDGPPSDESKDVAWQLALSVGKLVIEDDNLSLYGPTSAFFNLPSRGAVSPGPRRSSIHPGLKFELCLDETSANAMGESVIEWSRHLPKEPFLTRLEHDTLLNRFFKFFSNWCLRVIPSLFLRDMAVALLSPALTAQNSSSPPKTAHYSPLLHNSILAVAAAYSDDPAICCREGKTSFAKKAKEYVEIECARPTLSTVQALAILSSYHSGLSEQSLGFMYFGMSVRMSQALGLNVDCSGWVRSGRITHDDKIERNWIFWTVFTQDKVWSTYVGRDHSVPDPHADVLLPHVDPKIDEEPFVIESQGNLLQQPCRLTITFLETCKLMIIATRVMDVVYGFSRSQRKGVDMNLVTEIHLQLDTWWNSLPSELRIPFPRNTSALPHVFMVNLSYWWLTILLLRPFFRRNEPTFQQFAIARCSNAAGHLVRLFGAWKRLYGLRFSPISSVQMAFTAGTTFMLVAVSTRSTKKARKEAIEGTEFCIGFLNEMGGAWNAATLSANILRELLEEQLFSGEENKEIHVPDQSTNGIKPQMTGSTLLPMDAEEFPYGTQEPQFPPTPPIPPFASTSQATLLDSPQWTNLESIQFPGPPIRFTLGPQYDQSHIPVLGGMRGGETFPHQPFSGGGYSPPRGLDASPSPEISSAGGYFQAGWDPSQWN